jgi:hypothetical protein
MPDWLIPHSPTPLQKGLEGISTAAKGALDRIQMLTRGIGDLSDSGGWFDLSKRMGEEYNLPGELFARQMRQESGFAEDVINQSRKSSAGATGIAQFMPGTGNAVADRMGIPREEFWASPLAQLRGAAFHMRELVDMFDGDYVRALVGYNWGPGNAMSWNGTASGLPAETRHYLQTIFGGAGVPGVPGLAEGALVTRQTLAMIAEGNRPEMVIPLSKLGHLGTTYIHVDKIVIEGDSNNPERQAERIRSRLIRQGRRNGDIFGGYDG